MLIEKSNNKGKVSKFICDRCKIRLTIETRYAIQVSMPDKYRTTTIAHLCERCYKAMIRGIEKGVNRSEKNR